MNEAEAVPLRDDFRVAIICALGLEAKAVEKHFDKNKTWTVQEVGKHSQDANAYSLGCIDSTLVVLVWMPEYGKTAAATAAKDLWYSFRNIKHVLVVGICGGVPMRHKDKEIVLGDVVISTGLQRYDKGKQYQDAYWVGDAARTRKHMGAFLVKMSSSDSSQSELRTASVAHLERLLAKGDTYAAEARYPGPQEDLLYQSTHVHKHYDPTQCRFCAEPEGFCKAAREKDCSELQCGKSVDNLVSRRRLQDPSTPTSLSIHFGLVGSGDTVMKSGKHRDKLAAEGKVIAFEMEGAGVCDVFESMVVIKGVCDYADSHKSKTWQPHAAAAAAACTRAFLEKMRQEGYGALHQSRRGSFSSVSTSSTVNSFGRSVSSSSSEICLQSPVLSRSSTASSQSSLGQRSNPPTPMSLPVTEKTCKDVAISVKELSLTGALTPIWDEPENISSNPTSSTIPAEEAAHLLLEACSQPQPFAVATNLLHDPRFDINARTDKMKSVAHLVLGTAKVIRNKDKMMQIARCIRFLCHHKAEVNAADTSGLTPLHVCVKTANALAARELVKNKVDVNAADNSGQTALYLLGIDGSPVLEMVELLMAAGGGLNGRKLPDLQGRPKDVQRTVRKMLRC